MKTTPLIAARQIEKHFPVGQWRPFKPGETVKALNGVSFGIQKGETFGLVGESGCGKSTVARIMLGLTPPTGGQVYFEGRDIHALDRRTLRRPRQTGITSRRRAQSHPSSPGLSVPHTLFHGRTAMPRDAPGSGILGTGPSGRLSPCG
jgi:ABC-type oligopeptide transport system ATPase subunit